MTPFATEISNSISRYISHKAKEEELSNSSELTNALYNYLINLYPIAIKDEKNGFLCFALQHKKCSQKKSLDKVEEWIEYVPVHLIVDFKSANDANILVFNENQIKLSSKNFTNDGKTYRLKIEYKHGKVYLEQDENHCARLKMVEQSFWEQMHKLQNQLQSYTDVKNGFVILITNHDVYWESQDSCDSLLKVSHFNKITLLPEYNEKNITPCQIVWIKTRENGTNCCIGTFDEYFHSVKYQCRLQLKGDTLSYSDEFHRYPQNISKEKISSPSYIDKLKLMLSPGRIISSSKTPFPWESDFLNDYSRLMMSPAVRRMKDKTQVFTMDDSDFVRSRLTHSLEVANIAKLMGLGVEYKLAGKINEDIKKYCKDTIFDIKKCHIAQILEVAALVHDIGNPPYGHHGEKTIQNYFRKSTIYMSKQVQKAFNQLNEQQKADLMNFDGNVQGFRILCHLGLSNDCTSFNLNNAVLSTMIKYPFNSIDGNQENTKDHRRSKFGYFSAEDTIYKNICTNLSLKAGQRHPLAYLLEAADDITYIGDDIEDGWKLQYISALDIANHIDKLNSKQKEDIFTGQWSELKCRLLSSNKILEENAIQSIRIRMQRFMIERIINVFSDNIEDIVLNKLPEDHQELFDLDETLKAIHDIYWKPLVQHCYDGIHFSQLQGERVILALLNLYMDAIFDSDIIDFQEIKSSSAEDNKKFEIKLNNMTKSGMLFETISNNYRDELAPIGQFLPQDAYGKFMLVIDYISGMTDTFAYNRYHALCID